MTYSETYPAIERREVLRWSVCAAAVALMHALVLLALCARPDYVEPDAGAPIVMIELAPLSVARSARERCGARPAAIAAGGRAPARDPQGDPVALAHMAKLRCELPFHRHCLD